MTHPANPHGEPTRRHQPLNNPDAATSEQTTPNDAFRPEDPIGYLFLRQPENLFGRYFIIKGNVIIGSDPTADIQLKDKLIDQPHARINLEYERSGGSLVFGLYDFGTASGVHVNGHRVSNRITLRENDVLIIGGYVMVFKMLV